MANDTVTSSQSVRSICTPEQHAHANKAKPVILLALGTGPHGKTALLEFPEGWQRTMDLVTQFDGWHPLFADLAQEDRQRVRDHGRTGRTTERHWQRCRESRRAGRGRYRDWTLLKLSTRNTGLESACNLL